LSHIRGRRWQASSTKNPIKTNQIVDSALSRTGCVQVQQQQKSVHEMMIQRRFLTKLAAPVGKS
jgi:hypothetical protein